MEKTILLFDMDGTLTKPRNKITNEMKEFLKEAGKKVDLGVVSGSDLPKLIEQLGEDVKDYFKYVFCENGLVTFEEGECICRMSLKEHIGQEKYNEIVNFVLKELALIDIPVKTGTFIELRSGNLNISPIGRNCTQKERDEFNKLDNERHIRQQLIDKIKGRFPDLEFVYAIGGQISFDCFPVGWDKTFSLNHIKDLYETFIFFGDKTMKGGNDYEMAQSPLITKVHQVSGPEEVMEIMKSMGL